MPHCCTSIFSLFPSFDWASCSRHGIWSTEPSPTATGAAPLAPLHLPCFDFGKTLPTQSQATGLSSAFAHIHKSTSGLCKEISNGIRNMGPHADHTICIPSNYPRPCERGGEVLHLHWDLELQKCSRLPKDPASDVLSSHAYKAYNSSLIKDILSDQHFDLNWTIPSSVTDGMKMKIEKKWFNLARTDRKLHFATLPLHAFAVASDGVQCKIPQCILPDLMAPIWHSMTYMQTFQKYTVTK